MLSSEVIKKALEKTRPEIYRSVIEEIRQTLPENTIQDTGRISEVIVLFSKIKKIELSSIRSNTSLKYELIAVLLKLFQPEKLYELTDSSVKAGFCKEISTFLRYKKNAISNIIPYVIMHYRVYKSFNDSVNDTYNKIVEIIFK